MRKLRIFSLLDFNLGGFRIFFNLKYGGGATEKLKIPKIERIGLKKSQIKDVDETENIRRRKKEKDYQAYRNNLNKLLQQLEKDNIEKEIQVDIQFILQNDITAQAKNLS